MARLRLRSVSSDNFVVQDVTGEPRIIAEVDYDSAPSMVHEKAVYILEGRTYYVEKYDHKERRVEVREAEVDYYTDAISDHAVRFIDEHEHDKKEKPFFLYVAYTAPHWPLHAHEADVARYKGRFDAGWDTLREQRIERSIRRREPGGRLSGTGR